MESPNSTAYDLSLFEPREKYQREERKPKVKVLPQPKTARVSAATVVRAVVVSLVVVALLGCMMINNVKLAELNDEITSAKTKLGNAKSEQVSLEMQLESRMSLQNIEENAVSKLGLQKVQNYQVTYIHLNEGDKVEVTGGTKNTVEGFLSKLIGSVKEYFSQI